MKRNLPLAELTATNANRETTAKLLAATLEENKRLHKELAENTFEENENNWRPREFIVGDFGSISGGLGKKIEFTLLSYLLEIDESIAVMQITPEQTFSMGKAMLQIAKLYGVED